MPIPAVDAIELAILLLIEHAVNDQADAGDRYAGFGAAQLGSAGAVADEDELFAVSDALTVATPRKNRVWIREGRFTVAPACVPYAGPDLSSGRLIRLILTKY